MMKSVAMTDAVQQDEDFVLVDDLTHDLGETVFHDDDESYDYCEDALSLSSLHQTLTSTSNPIQRVQENFFSRGPGRPPSGDSLLLLSSSASLSAELREKDEIPCGGILHVGDYPNKFDPRLSHCSEITTILEDDDDDNDDRRDNAAFDSPDRYGSCSRLLLGPACEEEEQEEEDGPVITMGAEHNDNDMIEDVSEDDVDAHSDSISLNRSHVSTTIITAASEEYISSLSDEAAALEESAVTIITPSAAAATTVIQAQHSMDSSSNEEESLTTTAVTPRALHPEGAIPCPVMSFDSEVGEETTSTATVHAQEFVATATTTTTTTTTTNGGGADEDTEEIGEDDDDSSETAETDQAIAGVVVTTTNSSSSSSSNCPPSDLSNRRLQKKRRKQMKLAKKAAAAASAAAALKQLSLGVARSTPKKIRRKAGKKVANIAVAEAVSTLQQHREKVATTAAARKQKKLR